MKLKTYLEQPESKTLNVKKSISIDGKIFCVGSEYKGRESPIAIIGNDVYRFHEEGQFLDVLVNGDDIYVCGTIESDLVPYVGIIIRLNKEGVATKTSHCFGKFLCFKELSLKDNDICISGEYYSDDNHVGKIIVSYDMSLNILSRHIEGSMYDDEI